MVSEPSSPRASAATTLDLRGLSCPLPVLRTRRALQRMRPGERVIVLSTDPLAAIDIPHFVRQGGHTLEQQGTETGVLRFLVRKN